MKTGTLVVGAIVRNRAKLDWGLGKVLLIQGAKAWIYFKGIEGSPEEAIKNVHIAVAPLELEERQTDPWLDNLPPFVKNGKVVAPKTVRLTQDQAIERFVTRYPGRFEDPRYLEEERDYKWAAHKLFEGSLGVERLRILINGGSVVEAVELIKKVVQSVNLLSPYELMAFSDGLKDLPAARRYLDALATLLSQDAIDQDCFDQLAKAVSELPAEKGAAKPFTWPVVTLLPFLANPQRFMFLKPRVTKEAAERLAFDLLYDSTPQWHTYACLLKLSSVLMEDWLRPLGARDMIDVQSFIWVTASA